MAYEAMSNRIYIDAVHKPDSNLWGFNAYDDYDNCCAFNWEKLSDDDLDFFYNILTHENGYPDALQGLLDFAQETQKGITIRGTYYDWDELSDTYEKAMKENKQT